MNSQLIRSHFSALARYYDSYSQGRRDYLDHLDSVIVGWAETRCPRVHLDVGCGTGRLLEMLRKRVPRCRSVGIDNADGMINICHKRGLETELRNFFDIANDHAHLGGYDLITLEFNVLGYLLAVAPIARIICGLRKLLSPQGTVIMDVISPWCCSYGRFSSVIPSLAKRLALCLMARGDRIQVPYSVSILGTKLPSVMALCSVGRVVRECETNDLDVELHAIPYPAPNRKACLPVSISSSYLLFGTMTGSLASPPREGTRPRTSACDWNRQATRPVLSDEIA